MHACMPDASSHGVKGRCSAYLIIVVQPNISDKVVPEGWHPVAVSC